MRRIIIFLFALTLLATACSSDEATDISVADSTAEADAAEMETAGADSADSTIDEVADVEIGDEATFQIEVWADNWMAVYVDGELIGEDSVSITTERSFNAETFTFDASYPFTLAIEAKDFKETDSGIEYIGENNQQMGDGGIIAQIIDTSNGEVVSVTNSDWSTLVVHRAPINTECEKDADPDATCEFEIAETPSDWTGTSFDASAWSAATEWSVDAVGPKDGYDEISWDGSAQLIWGTDLEVDNTVLLRTTVTG